MRVVFVLLKLKLLDIIVFSLMFLCLVMIFRFCVCLFSLFMLIDGVIKLCLSINSEKIVLCMFVVFRVWFVIVLVVLIIGELLLNIFWIVLSFLILLIGVEVLWVFK